MTDEMDRIVGEAVRQGFLVWQTRKGAWIFRRGNLHVILRETPRTVAEWQAALSDLTRAGLLWPPRKQR